MKRAKKGLAALLSICMLVTFLLKLPQPLVMSGLRGDTLKFGMIQTVHGAKDQ